jgi:predicted Zn-dependent peptidase
MKHSELKQIIKEEVRKVLNESDYDQAMQNLAKKADINLSKPEGRNKFREREFKVGYTWRNGEEKEDEIVTVKAKDETEALAKAKEDAPRLARANGKFEIIKDITESQQLQSLEQQAKDFVSKYGKVKIKI